MIVNLCRPSFPVKQASVIPFHKIICLSKLFPDQGVEFVWNGEILLQRMTFLFYQIAPLSSIVVLSDDVARRQTALAEWLTLTRDMDLFNERIATATSHRTKSEAARLQDLRAFRILHRGRAALAGIEIMDFNQPKVTLNRPTHKTQLGFEATPGPISEALPNPWKAVETTPTTTPIVMGEKHTAWRAAA
jgi:hypothetical protein